MAKAPICLQASFMSESGTNSHNSSSELISKHGLTIVNKFVFTAGKICSIYRWKLKFYECLNFAQFNWLKVGKERNSNF